MRKHELVYYNGFRHYLMYRFDPPKSRCQIFPPADEVLGTGVDSLAVGLAVGADLLARHEGGPEVGRGG